MRSHVAVCLALSFVLLLAGCAGSSSATSTGPGPTPTPAPTPASSPTPNPTPTPAPTPTPSPTPAPSPTPTPSTLVQAVVTRNYDNMRSGVNSQETVLTPQTVNAAVFGKLFAYNVDAHIYGQPLYVAGLSIPGQGTHNVIFVATENDTVYAFDADQNLGQPLWSTSLLDAGEGETAVPCADVDFCSIGTIVGVTATPVISLQNNAIYVEDRSVANGTYLHKLHALDLTTGAEKFGGPVVITASVPGTASDAVSGNVVFNPLRENSRPGLLLVNGVVYICFASLNDITPYHGWVLGYSADTLQQVSVFNTTPNGTEGGIWGNNGPGADSDGDIYVVAGNGTPSGTDNYGQSYIRLTPQNGQLAVADFFTPFNAATLNLTDLDVGSSGFLLLPDQTGTTHTHMLVAAGKEGRIYLVDRDNMGKFNSSGDQIVQSIPNAVGSGQERNYYPPLFWNGNVYFSGVSDVIRVFSLQNGLLSTSPVVMSGTTFGFPGAGMVLSANGNGGGVLWALEWNSTTHDGTLHAYDPTNVATEFWNSDQSGTRDSLGLTTRLNVPLVVNGKVYVSGNSTLTVFGLLP